MSRLVIEAGKTERAYWSDLWRYRELFFFLSWRDILVRYKQTVIGVLWAVIRPVLTIDYFHGPFWQDGQIAVARLPIRCWFAPALCRGNFFPPP